MGNPENKKTISLYVDKEFPYTPKELLGVIKNLFDDMWDELSYAAAEKIRKTHKEIPLIVNLLKKGASK